MKVYRIKVRTPEGWEYGRPTKGVPYQYITREQAENAAQLWGDAYLRGDVIVVEEES